MRMWLRPYLPDPYGSELWKHCCNINRARELLSVIDCLVDQYASNGISWPNAGGHVGEAEVLAQTGQEKKEEEGQKGADKRGPGSLHQGPEKKKNRNKFCQPIFSVTFVEEKKLISILFFAAIFPTKGGSLYIRNTYFIFPCPCNACRKLWFSPNTGYTKDKAVELGTQIIAVTPRIKL